MTPNRSEAWIAQVVHVLLSGLVSLQTTITASRAPEEADAVPLALLAAQAERRLQAEG